MNTIRIQLQYNTTFDLKITFRILHPEIIKYINENPQNVVILKMQKQFQYQSKIIGVIELKSNIFPVIDLNEHINTISYLLRNFSDVYA